MAHSFFQHNTKDNNQSVGMGSLFAHTHFNMAENRDKKNSNIARPTTTQTATYMLE